MICVLFVFKQQLVDCPYLVDTGNRNKGRSDMSAFHRPIKAFMAHLTYLVLF